MTCPKCHCAECRRAKVNERLEQFLLSRETPPKIPTPEEIEAAKTPAGGWTRQTLASWGVDWPPVKGWRKRLEELSAGADN